MPKIILISGKARSGKDTFAMYFSAEAKIHGKRVLTIKYGDILKFICKEYFDWDGIKDEKGRTLLQQIGTNLCRENNPDIWVNCVIEIIKGLQSNYEYVLIPDARFPNEIRKWWQTDFDSITVRIERMNKDDTEYDNGLSEEQKQHPSETELDDWIFNYHVYNKYVTDLQNAARGIFKEMEKM